MPASTPAEALDDSPSSYFTYPVRYAVSGVFRRISSGLEQATLSYQKSQTVISSDKTLKESSSAPLTRSSSPFHPPPLTALSLTGNTSVNASGSRLLTIQLAEEVRLLVPPRLQLIDSWKLLFSLEEDGSSLATLYEKCGAHKGSRSGFVIIIKDNLGGEFGAYLNEPPQPSGGHYYGNGECFLWRASRLSASPTIASLPPPPSADTTHLQRMTTVAMSKSQNITHLAPSDTNYNSRSQSGTNNPDRLRFKAFPYSGINDYMLFCEHSFMSVGGGDGHYGLWIDGSLEKGISDSCPTFGNEPLSDEGKKFECIGLEVWRIG